MGKVYDLNNPVAVPWDDWEAAKAALDADEAGRSANLRFNWKFNKMGAEELVGWPLWERASALYFKVCSDLSLEGVLQARHLRTCAAACECAPASWLW